MNGGNQGARSDVVELARTVCNAPVALVSFVAEDRQWFKSRSGFESCETPLEQSICAHALKERELLVVSDLTLDPRTCENTLVTHDPYVRFYAGVVLRSPEGQPLGTVCVLDVAPRPEGLTEAQSSGLLALGRQVMSLLAMRRAISRSGDALIEQARSDREQTRSIADARAAELTGRLAIEATRIGVFDYDLVSGELAWDGRVRELFGAPVSGPVTYEGSFLANLHPEDRDAAHLAVVAALDPAGSGLFDQEYRTVAPGDGEVRWIAAHGQSVVLDGKTLRLVGTVRDITARKTADEMVAATLERYRLVGRITKDPIRDWDVKSSTLLWNEALTAAYGYRLDEVGVGVDWWFDRIHLDDRDRVRAKMTVVAARGDADWTIEYRFQRADGGYADVFDRGHVIRNRAGRAARLIGAMLDQSERKAEEERQRLVNGELSHRMKNILAMVQAIAAQTMRNATDMRAAQEVLAGRLAALAKAHDVLLGGAADAGSLSRIVLDSVRLHVDRSDRVMVDGPAVTIGSKAALPIVMLMHELGTNAAKYGALSDPNGSIDVAWTVNGAGGSEQLRLVWTERDGPRVVPPTRTGFGTRLIERGLAGQIGGVVKLDYRTAGAMCVLEAPLSRLQEDT